MSKTNFAPKPAALGDTVSIPVEPTVGATKYDNAKLRVRYCNDGLELILNLPAGPISMTLTHEQAEEIATVMAPK